MRDSRGESVRRGRPFYRPVVLVYDRLYRLWHRLDGPLAWRASALCVQIRPLRRPASLADGTCLACGTLVGILHLDNARIVMLHTSGASPMSVGLALRREMLASLGALARAVGDGALGDVRAFAATTIFHEGLARLGFQPEPGAPAWPSLVAAYQRALLASLHPVSRLRLRRKAYRQSRRLWLPREVLLSRFGPARRSAAANVGH